MTIDPIIFKVWSSCTNRRVEQLKENDPDIAGAEGAVPPSPERLIRIQVESSHQETKGK